MLKGVKLSIYPNKKQREQLDIMFGNSRFIDIVGEIPVVLTTGGIALTCKLVRACFFTLASSLVYFTNYLCYNS